MDKVLTELSVALRREPDAVGVRDGVGLDVVGRVGIITLSSPGRHNVLTLAGWQRLADVVRGLESQQTIQVLVVRGAGGVFSAGADIKEFPEVRLDAAGAAQYNEAIARALRALQDCPSPAIAMISGLAVGGGLELAAACDVRLADTGSRFGLPIAKLGVTLGVTETRALIRLTGPANLMHLVLSGRLVDAAHAERIGLVQEVHEPSDLPDATARLLIAISQGSVATIRALKAVTGMAERPLRESDTEFLVRQTVDVYPGADLAEGVRAFSERRPARFPSTL